MSTTDSRQHVHLLADQLPPTQLVVIEGLLSVMLDPVAHALRNAPIEDEEIGAEEEQAATYVKDLAEAQPGHVIEGYSGGTWLFDGEDPLGQGTGLKRISIFDQAKAEICVIPQPVAMNRLTAIHRLANTGACRVKRLG